jgi:hypothetical protein
MKAGSAFILVRWPSAPSVASSDNFTDLVAAVFRVLADARITLSRNGAVIGAPGDVRQVITKERFTGDSGFLQTGRQTCLMSTRAGSTSADARAAVEHIAAEMPAAVPKLREVGTDLAPPVERVGPLFRRIGDLVVDLPSRPEDVQMFSDADFERWWSQGFASAIQSRNMPSVQLLLALALANGLE